MYNIEILIYSAAYLLVLVEMSHSYYLQTSHTTTGWG